MSLSLVVGLQSYLVFNVSFFLSVLLLHCIQLTEQVRHQMQATLQEVYGVNLDHSWNRKVTDSWDKAQTLVRRTQLVLSLGSGLPFLPG